MKHSWFVVKIGAYSRFLGYDQGGDGNLVINHEQAIIVKLIFKLYLEGYNPNAIGEILNKDGIPTASGTGKWSSTTIRTILKNEKYKGDVLMQKKYTENFLTRKQVVNDGVIPQYYIENNHEAIIDPEVFDLVQFEIKKRSTQKLWNTKGGIYTNKIICGECGSVYSTKIWHSNKKYRREVLQCRAKYRKGRRGKGNYCKTPHLEIDDVKEKFLVALNSILQDKSQLIEDHMTMKELLFDTSSLEKEETLLLTSINETAALIEECVSNNARSSDIKNSYNERYQTLVDEFNHLTLRYEETKLQIETLKAKKTRTNQYMKDIVGQDQIVTQFEDRLWLSLLDFATVYSKDDITFTFKDGTKVAAENPRAS